MSNPTDPPRPALEADPYTAFDAYGWDTNDGLVDSNGTQVFAWLNQTGTPGKTATVYWEFGTAAEAGSLAVLAVVTQSTYDIIKNGTYSSSTGLVTHLGDEYGFRYEMSAGSPSMKPFKV